MGDTDHGHAALGQVGHDIEDLVNHFRVERRGGLVEKHDLRVHGQGAGDSDALLLAAGELCRVLVGLFRNADTGEQLVRTLAGLGFGGLADLQWGQHDIVANGHVAEEVELLENHANLSAQAGEFLALFGKKLAVDANFAAVDGFQAVDGSTQCGLTGAGGAEDNYDLTSWDFQVDITQSVVVAVVLVHPGNRNHALWCG